MKRNTQLCPIVMVFGILIGSQFAQANPFLIAKKIRDRPKMLDLGPITETADAIIEGAEGIEVINVKVGRKPSVKLNVLVVKPMDYGFDVVGGTEKGTDGEVTLKFAIKYSSSEKLGAAEFVRVLSPRRQREFAKVKEKGLEREFDFKTEEVIEMMKLTAQKGGTGVEAKSKTIFYLNGHGVSNRTALPWALVLAKQGYQVIAPDLRGIGKSKGKGPTFGKHEVDDLMDLLTQLRTAGRIGQTDAVGVMGVSYGAGIASLWTAGDPRVTGTVLIAPYAQADETLISAAETLKKQLDLPFAVNPESTRKGVELAAKMMGVTWEELAPARAIPAIGHPMLFVTSPGDDIIPASVVKGLHQSAQKESVLRSVNVPHMFLGLYLEELEPDLLSYFEKTLR